MPVIYRQTLSVVAGKKPDITNAPIKEKDFEIPPSELLEVSTWGESTSHRFKVADGSVDLPLTRGNTPIMAGRTSMPENFV